jgi:hypothetical protein
VLAGEWTRRGNDREVVMQNDIISVRALKKDFTEHEIRVLANAGRLQKQERAGRRGMRKYKIVGGPLDKTEASRLALEHYTHPLEDQVGNAFGEFESLASELREWHDNLPKNLQDGDKGSQLEEGAYALEGLNQPDVPEVLKKVQVLHFDDLQARSRSARCSEACSLLDACINELEEFAESDGVSQEEKDAAEELKDELQTAKDNAEGVEFPGMY